jgi:hypothetical protein
MKKILLLTFLISCQLITVAQTTKSQNVVIVTMDGLRWQEVFGGADSLLTFASDASYSTKWVQSNFWAPTAQERRQKLMPFFWTQIDSKGVLLGNRQYGNYVNNANPYWFSYPGYNEIFTGYPDPEVNSNQKIPNKNETVFEYLNKLPEFKGKTASFASWSVFASIFNDQRCGFLVNDGFRDVPGKLTPKQVELNRLQHELPDLFHGGERLDIATFNIGFEYMKVNKPRLIHFGLGDTDEFAHQGTYDYYLDAAKKSDDWIRQIWEYIQSDPFYANKTTLLITTDHGRGAAEGSKWKHHGEKTEGSSEIWFAAIGPSVQPEGESRAKAQFYQGQVASTIAKIVGKEYKPKHKPLPALPLAGK